MTSIKYTLLVGASSLAIVLSAASAGATGYGGIDDSFNTKTDIDVTKIDDSFNKTDVDVTKIDDSFNRTDVDVKKIDDSYNTVKTDIDMRKDDHSISNSFNKTDVDIRKDDHSVDDSFNTMKINSDNTSVLGSYNTKLENSNNSMKMNMDNHAVDADAKFFVKGDDVTTSALAASVANNSVAIKMGDGGAIEGNFIGDYVQQNADGLNLNLQNSGANASNQQSVAVRANVYEGSMGHGH